MTGKNKIKLVSESQDCNEGDWFQLQHIITLKFCQILFQNVFYYIIKTLFKEV